MRASGDGLLHWTARSLLGGNIAHDSDLQIADLAICCVCRSIWIFFPLQRWLKSK